MGKRIGGRQKGTLNKNKQVLLDRIEKEYPGYHPVMAMVAIAHDTNDEGLKAQMHKEVAQYVTPKLKSVEHTGEVDHQIQISWK